MNIGGIPIPSTSPLFLALLAVHVPAALVAVVTGAGAALTRPDGPCPETRRHRRFGRVYAVALCVVVAAAAGLAAMRWRPDRHLFVLGMVTLALAATGLWHRWRHRPGHGPHIVGMGGSYVVMLTAFYVDNGPHLPLWDRLPTAAYWLLPSTVGVPLIWRAVLRSRRTGRPEEAGNARSVPWDGGV